MLAEARLVTMRLLAPLALVATVGAATACKPPLAEPPPAAATQQFWSFVTFSGEDTSTQASVFFVAKAEVRASSLSARPARSAPAEAGGKAATGAVRITSHVQKISGTPRWVYRFDLEQLAPAVAYEVALLSAGKRVAPPRRFATLPRAGGLRVAFGGDLYSTRTTERLLTRVATERADVLVLGGDLAYGNGLRDNYGEWDRLLGLFDRELVRSDGLTVPIIAAIGNHEVEWKLAAPPTPVHAPFFYAFFADEKAGGTYFARRLSDQAVLLVLDSGHMTSHASQVPFIDETLTRYAATPLKIATYHVPLWPSHRPLDGDLSVKGRTAWGPRFDAHGLNVAMENHDHTLKRTKLMRAGRPDPAGTLYLGDGCMGASERAPDVTRPYLARTSGSFHFWLAEIGPRGASFRALSPDGAVLDEVEVKARAPALAPALVPALAPALRSPSASPSPVPAPAPAGLE